MFKRAPDPFSLRTSTTVRYEFESGAIYDGEWLEGNRHGVGKQANVDGNLDEQRGDVSRRSASSIDIYIYIYLLCVSRRAGVWGGKARK